MNKKLRNRKKRREAARQEPKPATLKCFEISFEFFADGIRRDIKQYFFQPRGDVAAILDGINFVRHEVERYVATGRSRFSVDRVFLLQWQLAVPTPDGGIGSRRVPEPVFDWTYAEKIKSLVQLEEKKRRLVETAAKGLDRYRPFGFVVSFEEVGREILNETGVPLYKGAL